MSKYVSIVQYHSPDLHEPDTFLGVPGIFDTYKEAGVALGQWCQKECEKLNETPNAPSYNEEYYPMTDDDEDAVFIDTPVFLYSNESDETDAVMLIRLWDEADYQMVARGYIIEIKEV